MRPPRRMPKAQLTDLIVLGHVANRETKFDAGVYRDPELDHLLLVYRSSRVVAMSVLDDGGPVEQRRWSPTAGLAGGEGARSTVPWRISFVWCLPSAQKRGLATWMLTAFGARVRIGASDFGWHEPFSAGGEALARRVSPRVVWTYR